MGLSAFTEAAKTNTSLIFTFAPENTVSADFVPRTIAMIEQRGGQVCFVRLTISDEEQERRRINSPPRATFKKLRSLDALRTSRTNGAGNFPALPDSGLTMDTVITTPEEAARRIAAHFALAIRPSGSATG